MTPTETDVRAFVAQSVRERGASDAPADIDDGTDLVASGILDSIGFVELLGDVEDQFGVEVDLSAHDPSDFVVYGTFVRAVVESLPSP